LVHGEEWETNQIPKSLAKAGAWLEEQAPGEEPFIKPWMIEIADDRFELDVSRTEESLGWHPRHNLRAELPQMIERLKSNPRAWYHENKLAPPRWLDREGARSATLHPPTPG